jgi:hypothetical protein
MHCFAAESESRIVGQGQDISKVGGVSGKIKMNQIVEMNLKNKNRRDKILR